MRNLFKQFHWVAVLAVFLGITVAQADSEHPTEYLAVSPRVRLQEMTRMDMRSSQGTQNMDGIELSPVTRAGTYLSVEASMILKNADFNALLSDSRAFGRYVQMGMPNLRDSRIVVPGAQEFITWTHMATSTPLGLRESRHFMQVRLTPAPNSEQGQGQTWVLYSPTDAERRRLGITLPENSAFWDFEGAWYMQPLSDGSIYCRYYIAGTMKDRIVTLPIARGQAMRQFGNGVYQIMLRLATRAQERARRAVRVSTPVEAAAVEESLSE
jgi:hypothetical protein